MPFLSQFSNFCFDLFILQAQELLTNIASLESAVSKLEKDLNELYYQLCHERNERLLAESKPGCLPSTSPDHSLSTCTCTWEEVSFFFLSKYICLLSDVGVIDTFLLSFLAHIIIERFKVWRI